MNSFLQRHEESVTGMVSGFDRVRFRGTLRLLANARGMNAFLLYMGVLFKDFKAYVQAVTEQIRRSTEALVRAAGRRVIYLNSSSVSKEEVARAEARRAGIQEGLICVLSCVEVLWSYEVRCNLRTKMLEVVPASRKCLHYYHYFMDRELGFMHARLATWFPMTMHVCINGREWLGRQMDKAGIAYARRENCFTHIGDVGGAQELLTRQLGTNWSELLEGIRRRVNPVHEELFARRPVDYYWSAEESEWASDVMFKSPAALARVYPGLVRHGIQTLGSGDVLRFLGKRVALADGGIHQRFNGEVVTDVKERPEGVRVKHRVNRNAIKMYDKQGSVLRVETTVNDARDWKVYRPKEGDREDAPKRWQRLRKGVADMHRRAAVCQAANERYLDALAKVEDRLPLGPLAEKLCQPVRWKGRQSRALNPLSPADACLLQAVSRGEFTINGFRNRDLRALLHGKASSSVEHRRQAGAITRKLQLLRAHRLIRKVPKTHRYQLTPKGRSIITALLTARQADTATLAKAA
jgi:hypothetical protein